MDFGISGRVALIAGANSGIGLETARQLLTEGVRVAITDLPGDDLEAAEAQLAELGDVSSFAADLRDGTQATAMFQGVISRFGAPDILVSAAGITGATGDFLSVDDDGWMDTLDTNLMSAVRLSRLAIPAMRSKKWGRIILIGSEDGVQPYVDELAYCASKAAIINLAKGLSKAYGEDNVLVNTVSPAFIATPMTDKMMKKRAEERGESFEKAIESFLEEERPGMVLKRRGKAEEVAAVIAFLCSEQASFVTGSNVRVDSGSVMTAFG
jgi:3-oxoacyl-[acyl-carrier protein] reductase